MMRVHPANRNWEKTARRLSCTHPLFFWLLTLLLPPFVVLLAITTIALAVGLPLTLLAALL